ncbi:Protein fem-1 homolog B, partial [Gryllus bimaculatus]
MAAAFGSLETLRALVEGGVRVRGPPGWGTPLLSAADAGHAPVVQHLLDLGCDPNAANTRGATPLLMAAQEGHEQVVALLLARGALVRPSTQPARTAVHSAARNGHERVLRRLLDAADGAAA